MSSHRQESGEFGTHAEPESIARYLRISALQPYF